MSVQKPAATRSYIEERELMLDHALERYGNVTSFTVGSIMAGTGRELNSLLNRSTASSRDASKAVLHGALAGQGWT